MKLRLIMLFSFCFATSNVYAAKQTRFARFAATFISERVGATGTYATTKRAAAANLSANNCDNKQSIVNPDSSSDENLNPVVLAELAANTSDDATYPDAAYFASPTCPLIAPPKIAAYLSKKN